MQQACDLPGCGTATTGGHNYCSREHAAEASALSAGHLELDTVDLGALQANEGGGDHEIDIHEGFVGLSIEELARLPRRVVSLIRGSQQAAPPPRRQTRSSAAAAAAASVAATATADAGDACSVCLADWTEGEECVALACRHLFHPDCVLPWLALRPTCPTCKCEQPR